MTLSSIRFHVVRGLTLAPAVLLFAFQMHGASTPRTAPGGARTRRGQAIFHQRCVTCHNKQPDDTSPFGPPNLHMVFHGPAPLSAKDAEAIILNGKGQMPAWGKVLTEAQIRDVISYLRAN